MANPHRFYIPDPLPPGSSQTLPGSVAHHIRKVLRLRDGETVHLWNGDGAWREAILHFEPDGVQAVVQSVLPFQTPASPHITLIQALPEGDKMDWIIEKACEAGVDRIVPVQARRSVVRLSPERAVKRFDHWQRVAIAACSQCGRARLPQIDPVCPSADAFEVTAGARGLSLFLSPSADISAFGAVLPLLMPQPPASPTVPGNPENPPDQTPCNPTAPSLTVAIGPEGGWDPAEHADALRSGFTAVKIAGNTLRTETAGLYVVAQIRAWAEAIASGSTLPPIGGARN